MISNLKKKMADDDQKDAPQPSKKAKPSGSDEMVEFNSGSGDAKWQITKVDVKERLAYLRKFYHFTDCMFIVGSGNTVETIHAHRMVLCMSSPKFEEILIRDENEGPVHITDVEPRTFHLMLDYFYLDKVELKSTEDACMLFKAAVQYQMPHLCEVTAKYVAREMTLDNVWPVLQLVAETQQPVLKEECGKFIRKNPTAVLRHEHFLKVAQVVVSMLVDLDCMDILELELITAVDKWAEQKCLDQTLPPNRENKREIIGPEILMKLRFLSLNQEDFVKKVAYTLENNLNCILSLEESYSILMNIVTLGSYPMPLGFNSDRRPRKLAKLRCIRKIQPAATAIFPGGYTAPPPGLFGAPLNRIVALAAPTLNAGMGSRNFSLDIKVNNPIILYGIQVPALWFPTQQGLKEYDESFIITVLDPSGSPFSHTVQTGKVAYGSSVDITLKDSIVLQKNVLYKIQVYTTNTYFLCKKLSNVEECPPVTFTLKDSTKVTGVHFPGNTLMEQSQTEFGFISQLIYSVWG